MASCFHCDAQNGLARNAAWIRYPFLGWGRKCRCGKRDTPTFHFHSCPPLICTLPQSDLFPQTMPFRAQSRQGRCDATRELQVFHPRLPYLLALLLEQAHLPLLSTRYLGQRHNRGSQHDVRASCKLYTSFQFDSDQFRVSYSCAISIKKASRWFHVSFGFGTSPEL